jgi:hypothetical protein
MPHVQHGDVHEVGLQDDCAGCADIASDPLAAADDRLLSGMMQLAARGMARFGDPRWSDTHLEAVARVLTAMERAGKLAATDEDVLVRYLNDTWRVRL